MGRLLGATLATTFVATLAALLPSCSSEDPAAPTPSVDSGKPDSSSVQDSSLPDTTPPETCGADASKRCAIGEKCATDKDCASLSCVEGVCKEPSCTNGTRDGEEVGVDCGGKCPKRCDGDRCSRKEECISDICFKEKCAPKGTKTCGVGTPAPCPDGEPCQQDLDCTSDYCRNVFCGPPPANVHTDGRRNGGETGIDCGGTVAATRPCAAGQNCVNDDDCISTCNASKTCNAPGPTDGKKNNNETDVDCGGPSAPKCSLTRDCLVDGDCKMLACAAKKCVEPTGSDGIKNGGETDVDCGGAAVSDGAITYEAPRCADDRRCGAGVDCQTGACSAAGQCVLPSCNTTETAGITTCGTKEVGDPLARHESCCRSLPLPTRTTRRLDKYEISAGRFRAFITAVGPNVRAWVANYVATHPGTQLSNLLDLAPVIGNLYPSALTGPLNLVAHLGAIDIDNYNGIRGCYNGYNVANVNEGSFGASTYWQESNRISAYGIPPRILPRATLDAKPMNCAMPMMYAAFCAWDGGELALLEDYYDVWPSTYPWGPADIGRPNYNWCNGRLNNGGWTCQDTTLGNMGIFYQFPNGTAESRDLSIWIAGPGRFPMDATTAKSGGESWMDFYGNLAEYTGNFAAPTYDFCDYSATPAPAAPRCTRSLKPAGAQGTHYTGIPRAGIIGRSWEGHNYGRGSTNGFQVTFQYGKFGGRCVRPTQ